MSVYMSVNSILREMGMYTCDHNSDRNGDEVDLPNNHSDKGEFMWKQRW